MCGQGRCRTSSTRCRTPSPSRCHSHVHACLDAACPPSPQTCMHEMRGCKPCPSLGRDASHALAFVTHALQEAGSRTAGSGRVPRASRPLLRQALDALVALVAPGVPRAPPPPPAGSTTTRITHAHGAVLRDPAIKQQQRIRCCAIPPGCGSLLEAGRQDQSRQQQHAASSSSTPASSSSTLHGRAAGLHGRAAGVQGRVCSVDDAEGAWSSWYALLGAWSSGSGGA